MSLINKDHLLHQLDGRPEDGWISIKAVRSMIEAEDVMPDVDIHKVLQEAVYAQISVNRIVFWLNEGIGARE